MSTAALQSAMDEAITSANAALLTTESSTQAELSSLEAALTSAQVELGAISDTVCNQPVCAAWTQEENGTCVIDCLDLTQRGVVCVSVCDAAGSLA
jgi:hypothetical protein